MRLSIIRHVVETVARAPFTECCPPLESMPTTPSFCLLAVFSENQQTFVCCVLSFSVIYFMLTMSHNAIVLRPLGSNGLVNEDGNVLVPRQPSELKLDTWT